MFYGSTASQEQSEFCGRKVGKKTCILLGLRFMDKYRGYDIGNPFILSVLYRGRERNDAILVS